MSPKASLKCVNVAKVMPHKGVMSDMEGKPEVMQLSAAADARVACLLDINLFPLKLLTWPCGTCEPTAGERANPGWVHTSLWWETEYFDRGSGGKSMGYGVLEV